MKKILYLACPARLSGNELSHSLIRVNHSEKRKIMKEKIPWFISHISPT